MTQTLLVLLAGLSLPTPSLQTVPPAQVLMSNSLTVTIAPDTPFRLDAQFGGWDLSAFDSVYFNVTNPGTESIAVWARAENENAAGAQDAVRAALILGPGKSGRLRLRLMRRPEDPTYAPFRPFYMYTKGINVRDNTLDPVHVNRITVSVEGGGQVLLKGVAAEGVGTKGPVPFFPFVDKYGQYVHTDWPGKIHDDREFGQIRKTESAELRRHASPSGWDKWGGWAEGPKLEARGNFYTTKLNGKWWFVDPDGHLFWSYGPTGVGFGEGTPVSGRENWFAELPDKKGKYGRYWGHSENARYMFYENKSFETFDFSGMNAERMYGKNWRTKTADMMHQRMHNWGFNTIGNWSDSTVYLRRKTPYVVAIHYRGPWPERVPDVFNPLFDKSVRERMEQERKTTANDPYNIGYFVDNELQWGWMDKGEGIIQDTLRATANSVTKQKLVEELRTKYGEISALNAAWGANYPSWDAILQGRDVPEVANKAARSADLQPFGMRFVERYFSVCRDAVKAVAPKNLYLGCRFHGHIDLPVVQVAAKYADVISYNVYEAPDGRLNRYIEPVDRPFLVGEFGIDSDPWQTPFRGDKLSVDPNDRVREMERWVLKARVHPLIVGAHFFQFRDQPLSGRTDGEAVLRGFVNTADMPHFELVQLNRRLAKDLYEVRSKK